MRNTREVEAGTNSGGRGATMGPGISLVAGETTEIGGPGEMTTR